MPTLLILVAGLTIVIGGILVFRLHAFVALILAGLTVAVLTPSARVTRSAQLEARLGDVTIDSEAGLVVASKPLEEWRDCILVADPGNGEALTEAGVLIGEFLPQPRARLSDDSAPESEESIFDEAMPVSYPYELTEDVAAEAPLYLIARESFEEAVNTGKKTFIDRLTAALGSYCGQLAILIVAASIIGRCLLDSGAADRIVRSALDVVGERNAPAAFVASGFTLSIPVFFDTVFYLMIPLGKAMRLRTGKNYLLYVLAIVAGGTMAHSLVPPTPGPLFIAEAFGVSLLAMIVGGCIVGLFSSSVGMIYAVWANRRFELQLPDEPETEGSTEPETPVPADLSQQPASPGILVSLTPILLPVLMITLGALVSEVPSEERGVAPTWEFAGAAVSKTTAHALKVAGNKNIALLVSAVFAVLMYVMVRRPSKDKLAAALQHAVASAGTIILVTAAGGAFGRMMRQTSVAELLQDLPGTSPVMVVIAAFLVTTAVRTAQGSSTVAMITAAGIFGGLVSSGAAGVDPLYVALAVGCGSKPIAWMNDSGFWVITRMSGMTEKEGLKYITPMTAMAGVAGLCAVIAGVILFP